jgi:hypothetical protein
MGNGIIDTSGLSLGNGARPIALRLVDGGRSSVVGNKVRVRPKQHDDWTITPNLWGAIIGPPSAMKSPAMQAALAPAYMLQDEMRTLWEQRCATIEEDDMLAGLEGKAAKAQALKALKQGDREAARKLLKDAADEGEELPPCPRLIVNDATVEKLGELLNENRNGLLLIRDELPGFLSRMEDQECQGERAFYLEAFNGGLHGLHHRRRPALAHYSPGTGRGIGLQQ